MTNYLELAQLPDGTIVLRRSDDHDNPIVKISFSNESKDFLQGQELAVAKEMIKAGIESVSGNVSDLDEFLENQKGINKKLADTYVAELFLALSQDALNKSSKGFKKLVADSQTPKGLNMQVLNELKKGKFFTKFTKALENVNKRVSK